MRIRRLVIPMDQAQAGMVWGQPLEVVFRRMLTLLEGADLSAPRMAACFDPMFGRLEVRSSQAKAFFETPIHPRPADHHAHHPHC